MNITNKAINETLPFLSLCTESDCPISHPHQRGVYRYQGKDPHKYDFVLGKSNPPPHVWEAITKMGNASCSVEDDEAIAGFFRYHVPDMRWYSEKP